MRLYNGSDRCPFGTAHNFQHSNISDDEETGVSNKGCDAEHFNQNYLLTVASFAFDIILTQHVCRVFLIGVDSHVLPGVLQLYIHKLYEHTELHRTRIENRSVLLRPKCVILDRFGMNNNGTSSNLSYTACGMVPLLVERSGAFVCTIAPHLLSL